MVIKDILKPAGKFKISNIFINSRNGQLTITLPKRKMKKMPERLEISYW
jgi:HSP20 family molecular chaperone IbpA